MKFFFEPIFPVDVIEKERRAVLNEIKQDMDSRWFKFHEFFKKTRYIPGSPLLRRVGGTIDVVSSLTRRDLLDYWKTYFTPANTYIFLIGNLTEVDTKSLLEKYFGKHTSGKQFPGFPDISNTHLAERKVAIRHDPELRVNYMDLVFPSLSMSDDLRDRVIQNIALIILGRLRTSRLFQLLRYDKGLVYGISANDSQWPQTGYAYVTSEVSGEHLNEVVDLIVREVTSFRAKGPLEGELEFTKNYLSNSWLMAFDNPSSIADWISDDLLWKEKILLPEDYIAILKDITVPDLISVMQKHWDMRKLQLIVQGPLKDDKDSVKKFTSLLEPLSD